MLDEHLQDQGLSLAWQAAAQAVRTSHTLTVMGRVTKVTGILIEARGPASQVGELCRIDAGVQELLAEVVGFREDRTLLMPGEDTKGS